MFDGCPTLAISTVLAAIEQLQPVPQQETRILPTCHREEATLRHHYSEDRQQQRPEALPFDPGYLANIYAAVEVDSVHSPAPIKHRLAHLSRPLLPRPRSRLGDGKTKRPAAMACRTGARMHSTSSCDWHHGTQSPSKAREAYPQRQRWMV